LTKTTSSLRKSQLLQNVGKTEQELLGNSFTRWFIPTMLTKPEKKNEGIARKPYTCSLEQRAMTKEGWRWFSGSTRLFIFRQWRNRVCRWGWTRHNSTKIAEQEVQKKNELLHMSNAEKEKFFFYHCHDSVVHSIPF
jgi:hypothetical protein